VDLARKRAECDNPIYPSTTEWMAALHAARKMQLPSLALCLHHACSLCDPMRACSLANNRAAKLHAYRAELRQKELAQQHHMHVQQQRASPHRYAATEQPTRHPLVTMSETEAREGEDPLRAQWKQTQQEVHHTRAAASASGVPLLPRSFRCIISRTHHSYHHPGPSPSSSSFATATVPAASPAPTHMLMLEPDWSSVLDEAAERQAALQREAALRQHASMSDPARWMENTSLSHHHTYQPQPPQPRPYVGPPSAFKGVSARPTPSTVHRSRTSSPTRRAPPASAVTRLAPTVQVMQASSLFHSTLCALSYGARRQWRRAARSPRSLSTCPVEWIRARRGSRS